MTPVQILTAARELIAEPERWTTKVCARSATGKPVSITSKFARSWCMVGSIEHSNAYSGNIREARIFLNSSVHGSAAKFNDARTTTHADVLAAFDRAIALASAAREGV